MMATILSIWTSIKMIFTSGILWKTILAGITSKALEIITNKEVQNYALWLVVSLQMNTEMTTLQKASEFNSKMLDYFKEKNIVTTSGIINFLRELAYQSMTVLMAKEDLPKVAASIGATKYIG